MLWHLSAIVLRINLLIQLSDSISNLLITVSGDYSYNAQIYMQCFKIIFVNQSDRQSLESFFVIIQQYTPMQVSNIKI